MQVFLCGPCGCVKSETEYAAHMAEQHDGASLCCWFGELEKALEMVQRSAKLSGRAEGYDLGYDEGIAVGHVYGYAEGEIAGAKRATEETLEQTDEYLRLAYDTGRRDAIEAIACG